ncbi:Meiotically up-regulated protein 14 protein [Fusarium odoratissimum]|uniref:Meiotically up-regulated protein 14 protein n=1 Tax=Fusarium oxysporum f. sp. cubense (strain race 4) TaxID=2502994 RepID=N1SA46_FUSC4|nr:Meiotically up-regulated protein 14 protein [Fusarium odoratissimum]
MVWSVFGRPIKTITQDAVYLYGDGQAVYRDFGGVVVTQEEGDKIGKAMILQNHGLLTTGAKVDGACFLMTLVERASQCQLLAEDASVKYIFENSSDPETLHWEGQPDLEYEEHMCKGEHKL